MRVVEYEKSTQSLPYQLIKGAAMVSGVFALVVCALLIANNLSLKKTDPIHSPALQRLVEELKTNPNDEALREEIRELDQISRRAFFTSQHFNRMAIYMLVGGLLVMVVAFKSLEAYTALPPFPDSQDPKDDLVEKATWARKSITSVGLVLVGFALMIALPWESTLDLPEAEVAASGEDEEGATTAGAATPTSKVETVVKPAADAKPVASAEERLKNWPGFLGPRAGLADAKALPTTWDGEKGEGIRWKTEIPLPGFNSPIIWEDKIFLSGADEKNREVYCVDRESGKILWTKKVEKIPGSPSFEDSPEVNDDTGYAAATMATDGVRVFAIFSNGDLVAFDFEGSQVWAKNLGVPENAYGYSSSLVVYESLLLIQYDRDEDSFFTGLDVATGQKRWRTPRDFGASWSTPLVFNSGERDEVVLVADPMVVSYDPKNGKELWRVECLEGGEIAPMAVYMDGLLYVAADYVKVAAIDVKKHEVVWETSDMIPGIATPLVMGDYYIGGLGDGGIICYNAKSGEEVWMADTDDGFYASPILADGKVYLADRTGVMHIFEPGAEYKALSTPALGEVIVSTPAAMGDTLYVRGMKNLYRIGP
ncbi:MAG: PQQ-binding-like beta-propeller repeat protein [Verrucomicrobiota bacterium]